jgi:hypothetical protein
MLRVAMTVAACTVIRCGSSFVGPDPQVPDAFAGAWRSVTPSFEFLRLSVFASSGETCGVAARLTFSGVAWEGNGQLSGDSLVFQMSTVGSTVPTGSVVAHARDARTLGVQVRPASAAPMNLTFVRD